MSRAATAATREEKAAARTTVNAWIDHPARYVRDTFGMSLLPFQRRVLDALRKYKRVLVVTAPGTGKTLTAALAVLWFTPLHPGSHCVTTGPSWQHLEMKLWPQIATLVSRAKYPLGHRAMNTTDMRWSADWMAYAASPDRPEVMGGTHKPSQLAIFDDAHAVDDSIWKMVDDNFMAGHGAHWLAIGNPLSASGPFYRASLPGSGWHVVNFSALEHPNVIERREVISGAVTHEKVDRIRKHHGETSPEWKREVLGEFADDVTRSLISRAMLVKCANITPTAKDGAHLGIDIAGEGDDENVASLVVDRKLVEVRRWSGVDTMTTCGMIVNLVSEYRARGIELPWPNVHIDDTGLGAVGPRLNELGHDVDRVNFGAAASGAWDLPSLNGAKLMNMRAEMYAVAAELLRDEQLSIPDEYEMTWIDLCQPEWSPKIRSDGARCLEPKDAIKRRIGRSPDYGDSLVLALCRSATGWFR